MAKGNLLERIANMNIGQKSTFKSSTFEKNDTKIVVKRSIDGYCVKTSIPARQPSDVEFGNYHEREECFVSPNYVEKHLKKLKAR